MTMQSRRWAPVPAARTNQFREMPNWKIYHRLDHTKDILALRWHILQVEGPDTLVNFIMAAHGRPNKF